MTTILERTVDSTTPSPLHTVSRIVLIGFMGAGKSTIGRMLAERLRWEFLDTDSCVEGRHSCTVAELFASHGEATFRRSESLELARALGKHQVVIAVGGGAPENLTNRLLLEQTPETAVIFLQASFPVLFDRCVLQGGATIRPVLLDAVAAEQRYLARLPLYRRCAQHCLDTADLLPEEAAMRVQEMLASQS